ncbi:thioredoxin family protein [Planctomycetota bacterium]|nr:thioredoxin family protein [Planctomycetota bacterium]
MEDLKSAPAAVIDFTATWCGPCQVVGPIVDKLATEFSGKAKIGKCDIDANGDVAAEFGIMGVPTFAFFKNGELVEQQSGALPEPVLRQKIEALLG